MSEMIQPELGQLLSGYYNGYKTPGNVTAGIDAIDALIGEHIYAARDVTRDYGTFSSYTPITSNSGERFVVEGAPFAMRSYSWAECDCGFSDHEWDITEMAETDTGLGDIEWDDPRQRVLTAEFNRLLLGSGFTEHKETCTSRLPNFHHFASDFRAYWYKHSHRGESCNQKIDPSAWRAIQRECEDWILAQPKGFRVLITGSGEWASELYEPVPGKRYKRLAEGWRNRSSEDVTLMRAALKEARGAANGAHMRIIHGGANGADSVAGALAWDADNASVEVHPALWDRRKDGSYNKAAGFERNQRMVDSGADICLAFLKRGAANRGAQDCIRRAKAAGIEVVEVWG
jgi:hypothetical protein